MSGLKPVGADMCKQQRAPPAFAISGTIVSLRADTVCDPAIAER